MSAIESHRAILSFRSVATGFLLAILLNIWVPYGSYLLQSSRMTVAHLPIAALILFLVLIFVANPLLRLHRPQAAFSPHELSLIFSMLLIASLIPGKVFVSYFIAIIATPYYFAAPENQWVTTFFPYLPDWLLASNQGHAMEWFYEGLPAGAAIPWTAWVIPIFWWMSFFVVLFFMGACTVTIFRKQWIEHEKLTFPLVKVPLDLIAAEQSQGQSHIFLNDRLFLAGCGIVLFVAVWNILSYFYLVSPIPIGASSFLQPLQLSPSFPAIPLRINVYMLCFAFFISLDILLSIWVFFLLGIVESGLLTRIGLSGIMGATGGNASVSSQFFGGFIMFVLLSVWSARRHLAQVCRKAFGRGADVDDSRELLPYRVAVFGLLGGLLYLWAWLYRAGLSLTAIPVFLAFLFILYFGMTKIIAETGLVFLDLPVNAHEITVLSVGSGRFSRPSLTVLGLASAYARNWRGMGMGSLALVDRMTDGYWPRKRGLLVVLGFTFVVSMVASLAYTVYIGYTTTGAYHFGTRDAFGGMNVGYYDLIVIWMRNVMSLGQYETWFMGIGAGLLWGLVFLRHRLPGWPFAPVGFTICSASVIRDTILSIFLAWLVKWVLMRLGGTMYYRRGQRFFIGALVGHCVGVTLSFFVDAIWFPGQGHTMHDW